MKAMEDWSREGQYTGLDVCTSSLDIFHCMLFLSANEHKLVKADKTFAAPCILLPDKKNSRLAFPITPDSVANAITPFLQLKVANRQNCLNAGAKLSVLLLRSVLHNGQNLFCTMANLC